MGASRLGIAGRRVFRRLRAPRSFQSGYTRGVEPRKDTRTFAERERRSNRWLLRAARGAVAALLLFFAASLLFGQHGWVFLDNVNLVLHEAGHVVFRPFGETLTALGGSLHQLLWPALFAGYFGWWRKDRFAAAVCGFWFGESLLNLARYVADARAMELPLVGGDVHDWNFLLTRWDVLHKTGAIAAGLRGVGWAIVGVCLALVVWHALRPSNAEADGVHDAGRDAG